MLKKISSLLKFDRFFIIALLLFTIIQTRYLFLNGMYTFSDEPHFANLYEMIRALLGGQFPPRWAPDMSYNFGYPLFNFYYPFPFYLGSFFNIFFKFTLIDSLKAVFFLSVLFSGISFYFLAHKFFSKSTSFLISLVYLFTPYRAVDLYVRGAIGELWSFVFMPLVLLTSYNLIKRQNLKNCLSLSVSLAGLILSHNLSAIIFLPIVAFFCFIFLFKETKILNKVIYAGIGLLAGLGLSAYYWLPAVLEKRFIQPGTPFDPFDHFPFIFQLIIPSWGYGASVWGPTDQISFQIGLVNLSFIVVSILIFSFFRKLFNQDQKRLLVFSLIVFLVSIMLMNIRSWFLWERLPLGNYLQFPWRLLMLTTLVTPLLGGFLEIVPKKNIGKPILFIIVLFSIFLTFSYFKPDKILNVDDNYYLNRFFINRNAAGQSEKQSLDYYNYSEDYLPLTIWTKTRPGKLLNKIYTGFNVKILDFKEITPTKYQVNLISDNNDYLIVSTYYFPGWKIYIDGKETEIEILKRYGEMKVNYEAGEHQIIINFEETYLRKISNGISVITIILLFMGIIYEKRNHKIR